MSALVDSRSLRELANEMRTVAAEFDRMFHACPPDDEPSGRERVRAACAAFHAAHVTRRLLDDIPRCVAFICDWAISERVLEKDLFEQLCSAVGDACSVFWNASARPDCKIDMIEQGVVHALIRVNKAINVPRVAAANMRFVESVVEASMGVIPNLCQSRFAHGHRNIHQATLAESPDVVPFLLSHIDDAESKHVAGYRATRRKELRVWFLAIHAIANLSMDEANEFLSAHFHRFDRMYEFCDDTTLKNASLWSHWNSLGSFTALLRSPHALVARWSLRSLVAFAQERSNMPRVFRALAVMSSIDDVHSWTLQPETAEFAERLLVLLGVGACNPLLQPDVRAPPPQLGAPALDRKAMSAFSDIDLVIVDDAGAQVDVIPAHKVVLASRSSYFHAKFLSGMRDANDTRAIIDDVDPAAFVVAINWLYEGRLPRVISAQLAVDLLGILCRFGMTTGGAVQQLEFLLINRIDSRETALALVELCSMNAGVLPKLLTEVTSYLERTDPTKTMDERTPSTRFVSQEDDEQNLFQ